MIGRNFNWQASAAHYLTLFSPEIFRVDVPEEVTGILRSMLHEGAWNDQVLWLIWCDALDEWGHPFACHVARYIRSFEPIAWKTNESGEKIPPSAEAHRQDGRPLLP